ncbi:MAG: hypothetical protein P8Y53_06360 [Pseudolabrys sp.]
MRSVTFVIALAAACAACAASPALAQARILTVQGEAQPPAAQTPDQPQPPARAQAPERPAPPKQLPAQEDAQTKAPQNEAPGAAGEGAGKAASSAASEIKRQDRALPFGRGWHPLWARFRGRFGFVRVGHGFLRLDRNSGRVAYCSARAGSWSCATVPERDSPLARQIDELRDEIAGLKKEVADLRAPPPHPSPPPQTVPPPPANQHGGSGLKLPGHADIARARGFIADTFADTWHRLVDMIETMQKDLLQGGGDDTNRVSRT